MFASPAVMHVQSSSSLRRAYLEWIEEQIEEYKDSIPRSELMRLAEQVVEELHMNRKGQYQLTEMLLCEEVDRKIFRILRLPSYRSWSAAIRANPAPPSEEAASE